MFEGKKILFVSRYGGFSRGIERYIHQTATILKKAGAELWYCFLEPARDVAEYLAVFDHVCEPGELPKERFDIASIHQVLKTDILERFLDTYGESAVLHVQDHGYYCPRGNKYFPHRHQNCERSYSRYYCGVCGMLRPGRDSRKNWMERLVEFFGSYRDRLDLLRRYPRVVVLSSFMRDNLLANDFSPENLYVLPPCIRCPEELPEKRKNDPLVILFSGTLLREKGADFFLRTLTMLKHPFHAQILGEGPERDYLVRLVSRLHLQGKVEFCGWSTQPEQYYANADIALLPGRWQEPFGLVAAEAASWGLPIVAFDLGGVREIVLDGQNGYLVPFGDLSIMSQKVDFLLGEPELRERFGKSGHLLVRHTFSEAELLKGYARLLKKS